tara:strand:+ start:448 stop:609 length:162 start_codon:yes stop_codon:yes gene_type:complete
MIGAVIGSIASAVLSERVIMAVLVKLGDYLVERSSNSLDNEVWDEVKNALNKK